MAFYEFFAGERGIASRVMENFRHFCGRGTDILPQDQNGNLLTDKSINIGSSTNQFNKIYCEQVVQSGLPSNIIGGISFNGFMLTLTSIAMTYSANLITATKTAHGLVTGDTISFNSQTGNNTVLNGTWIVTKISDNSFSFIISSTPAGSLSNANGEPIKINYKSGVIDRIGRRGASNGLYQVYWTVDDHKKMQITCNARQVYSGVQMGYFSHLAVPVDVTYTISNTSFFVLHGAGQSTGYATYNCQEAMITIVQII